MEYFDLLKDLTGFVGLSGYEVFMADKIRDMFEEIGLDVTIDDFYNVIGKKSGNGKSEKKIMISAHYDEIGFMVKDIDDRGFIRFVAIGGVDAKVLMSKEVIVHGKKDIYGVIGQKPPHLLVKDEASKIVKINDLVIDVGYTKEELMSIVSVGDIITFRSDPIVLNGDLMSDKTMDNRSGVLAMLLAAKESMNIDNDMDIYFVATTKEELNLAGASIVANAISPDFAIVIDACHAKMSEVDKDCVFDMNEGVVIAVGPNLHKGFTKKIMSLTKAQIDVEPCDTGTECGAIQIAQCGIATVLVSVPVKYMHTTIEMVHKDDIVNVARLVCDVLALKNEELEACLCY